MADTHPLMMSTQNTIHSSKSVASGRSKSGSSKRSRNDDSQAQHSIIRRRTKKTKTLPGDSSTSFAASHTDSTTLLETPPVHWVQGDGGNVKDPSHSTVVAYVSIHLFREVKFIPDANILLRYDTKDPTSICFNVLKGCKCSLTNVDREIWWKTKASNWVDKYIIHLRNSKVEALKNAFWSKSW